MLFLIITSYCKTHILIIHIHILTYIHIHSVHTHTHARIHTNTHMHTVHTIYKHTYPHSVLFPYGFLTISINFSQVRIWTWPGLEALQKAWGPDNASLATNLAQLALGEPSTNALPAHQGLSCKTDLHASKPVIPVRKNHR